MVNKAKRKGEILYVLRFFLKEKPTYLFVVFTESLIWSLTYIFTSIYLLKLLFDFMENEEALKKIIILILCAAILCLSVYLLNVVVNRYYKPQIRAILSEKIKLTIYKKYIELPLSILEACEIQENYYFIIQDSADRFFYVIEDLSKMIGQIVSILFIIGIFVSIDWLVLFFIIIFSILLYLFQLHKNKIMYEKEMALIYQNKEKEYINRLFYLPEFAKELRLTNITNVAFDRFNNCYQDLAKKIKEHGRRIVIIDMLMFIITSLVFDLLMLFYLTIQLMVYKLISIGDYIAAISSIWKLYDNITGIISSVTKFKLHSSFIRKYIDFIDLTSYATLNKNIPENFLSLEINNIGFSYNGQINAVNNLSLKIMAGEKIAIVGHNGAGKTTLIKLLLGLYDPQVGCISYNGQNINQFNREHYKNKFRLVSQDNNLYALPFGDNIFMDKYSEKMCAQYNEVCRKAQISDMICKHEILPTSKMTVEFDEKGIVLSGGENQRVSIARLFSYDSAEIYVLDEPNSALDAFQENVINEILTDGSMEKTLIVITHKLAIAKQVDRIYFLNNGEIVESGNHSNLMKQKGKYYELFNLQLKSMEANCDEIE